MTKKLKILITDVESRKGMDVVNIVQRFYQYESILCGSKDVSFQLPIIYNQKIERLRSSNFLIFSYDLNKIFKKFENYHLVYLPVSEKPTRFLYHYLRKHPTTSLSFLLPVEDKFDLCSDKAAFQKYCEQEGFPVPKSFTENDLLALKTNFRPLILKPRSGQGSVGIRYYHNVDELSELEALQWDNYLLQEKVESKNQVAGAFFLCKNGQVLNTYSHQRLRTFPPEGGVTVFSQSTYEEEIIKIGTKLLERLHWNGLAMIEFMYDELSCSWKIIELNPRIWGSILLSAFNGSEMLKEYITAAIGDAPSASKNLKSKYIRWIFPFDLLNWLKSEIDFKTFCKLDLKDTCYINFTYSSWMRSILYQVYFTFNFRSIKRFFKKLN